MAVALAPTTGLHLRQATLADIPALNRLVVESVRGLNTHDYTAEQIDSGLEYLVAIDPHLIQHGTYYVVEMDGQIVGAGGWSSHKMQVRGGRLERGGTLDPEYSPAIISAFYVHPAYARQGIGRDLLELCEIDARAAGFRALEVLSTLTGAWLYRSAGFRSLGYREITTADGVRVPGLKMAKRL